MSHFILQNILLPQWCTYVCNHNAMIKYLLLIYSLHNFQQSAAIYLYVIKTNTQQCSAILSYASPFSIFSKAHVHSQQFSAISSYIFINVQLFSTMWSYSEKLLARRSYSQQCPAIIINAQILFQRCSVILSNA